MHRDLKADNVLFWIEEMKIKIIDFGLSKTIDGTQAQMKTFFGTEPYMAPEMLVGSYVGGNYDSKVDVWAFGVLAYFLVFKTVPF